MRLLVLSVALLVTSPAAADLTATVGTDTNPNNTKVVIARNDGSDRRVLAAGVSSLISPDSSRVAVTAFRPAKGTFALELFSATGGAPGVSIPNLSRAVWSPDSTKLVTDDSTDHRLRVIDAGTGTMTTLATGTFDGVSFSPDSSQVAYVQRPTGGFRLGGDLKVTDLATGTTRVLRHGVSRALWGPDMIAFSTVARRRHYDLLNVAAVRPDGSGYRQLTHVHPTSIFFGLVPLAWSADGTRLLTTVWGSDGYWLNTYGVDAVHGGSRLIARGVEATALSRDGRYIIGQTGDAECCGYAHTNIVRVPWNGGRQRVLLRHAMNASYSG